nr:TonB-dependent siderophore receptor [uncultured Limnohabitans sp.]
MFLRVSRTFFAVALCLASTSTVWAEPDYTEITITAEPPIRVSGFEGIPLQELPMNVSVVGNAILRDTGAQRVTDALRLDASVSDSYNLPAYWDKLSVRGFALDNRYNFYREGLPVSAETIIPMDNKERIELLKGTSGIQAGTSAPGGLVNYVVKRAPSNPAIAIRDVTLSYGPGNNRLSAADLGGRFGQEGDFGYRFNVAHEDLDPYIRDTKGYRDLIALAMDWRINSSNRLEWEFEQSHHEQIGVNFYSLLASDGPSNINRRLVLPAVVDGTRNITRQPNAQPGVFDGLTGTIRLRHQLDNGWMWNTQFGTQRLRADDRLIYASGCSSLQMDSFCASPKGDFQIHDYRSDNEHRNSETLQTDVRGQLVVGGLEHTVKLGLMRQRQTKRMPQTLSDTLLGSTNAYTGGLFGAAGGTQNWSNTNSTDNNTELSLKDRVQLAKYTHLWLGLRHTQLDRQSIQTDGNAELQDTRAINTPWLALSHQLTKHHTLYASYGKGLEAESAPSQPSYANAGQPLPALRSTQHEVGLKSQFERTTLQATWFDITRPMTTDGLSCSSVTGSCTRQIDGQAHHQGLELSAQSKFTRWSLGGSAMWLDAKRENASVENHLNGQRPLNVPTYILRSVAEYRSARVVGLRSSLRLSREGERNVTENGSIKIPAWTTVDANTHYDTKFNNLASSWTLAIQNLANTRYWRESPRQYGQYFLYPGAPRTLRATVVFHL